MPIATAKFDIADWKEAPYHEGDGVLKMTRASVKYTYTGDLEGESQVEYVMVYTAEQVATYTSVERIVGTLLGRTGSFVLQGSGTYDTGVAKWSSRVVEGSGAGELAGIRGTGESFAQAEPRGTLTLNYELA